MIATSSARALALRSIQRSQVNVKLRPLQLAPAYGYAYHFQPAAFGSTDAKLHIRPVIRCISNNAQTQRKQRLHAHAVSASAAPSLRQLVQLYHTTAATPAKAQPDSAPKANDHFTATSRDVAPSAGPTTGRLTQRVRANLLDEDKAQNRFSRIKAALNKYKNYIPILREPRLFVAPRPAVGFKSFSTRDRFIHLCKETGVWAVAYGAAIGLPHALNYFGIVSSYLHPIIQPLTMVGVYTAYILLTPQLPLAPKGRPGLWFGLLRWFRSLILVTLCFIVWNIPLAWSIKMWLGLLYSDVEQIARLMVGNETDLISFVLLKPFIEELVFRGLLFARICRVTGTLPAAIVSSAAFAVTYGYRDQHVDWHIANDAFWTGFVFAYSFRLAGRLWLPIVLRYGSAFLVWVQCETSSPLNPDFEERQEMIGEVLYWLINNKVTPLKDIEQVVDGQRHADTPAATLAEVGELIFSVLDCDNKGYLSAAEFTYFFTLHEKILTYMEAAYRAIQQCNEADLQPSAVGGNTDAMFPSSAFVQATREQRARVAQLQHRMDVLERLQSVVDNNDNADEPHAHRPQDLATSNVRLQSFKEYYASCCQALCESRVIKSLPVDAHPSQSIVNKLSGNAAPSSQQITKQQFLAYLQQRSAVDEGTLYHNIHSFFSIMLNDSQHPLQQYVHSS